MAKRSIPAVVSVIAGAALALTGCSGSGSGPAVPTGGTGSGGTAVDITFWSAIGGMDAVTAKFNATHQNIHVSFTAIPNGGGGGYAKLATAIKAGNGPDVAGFEYPQLPEFAAAGQLQSLTKHLDKASFGKYPESARNLVTFGGQTYGVPYDSAPMIAYYRQDQLKAVGVDKAPATWKEFEVAGKKLKAKGKYIASFNPNDPASFVGLAWAAGARWFQPKDDAWQVNFTDSQAEQVAARVQRFINEGIVKVEPSFSDQWNSDLAHSKVVGVFGASWSATGIQKATESGKQKGDWIAAPVPTTAGTPSGAYYGGTAWAVTKSSKHVDAASEFAQWLGENPEAIKARGDAGSAYLAYPGMTAVAKKVFDAGYFANDIYSVFDTAYRSVTPDWQWGPDWDISNTALMDAFGKVGSGTTISSALSAAQQRTLTGLKQKGFSIAK